MADGMQGRNELREAVEALGPLLERPVQEWCDAKGLHPAMLYLTADAFIEPAKDRLEAGRELEAVLRLMFFTGFQVGVTLMERRGP